MARVPKSVLVVNSNRVCRLLLGLILEEKGFEVVTAPSGQAATLALEEASFDAILVDRVLSDMDGLAWLRDLREAGVSIPAIVRSDAGVNLGFDELADLGAVAMHPRARSSRDILALVNGVCDGEVGARRARAPVWA